MEGSQMNTCPVCGRKLQECDEKSHSSGLQMQRWAVEKRKERDSLLNVRNALQHSGWIDG